MDSVEINLRDIETEEEFKLQLSPTSAFRAQTGKFFLHNKPVEF